MLIALSLNSVAFGRGAGRPWLGPKVVAAPSDLIFTQGPGDRTVDVSVAFSGNALTYTLPIAPSGVVIDSATGLITIPTDELIAGATVAVAATNAGGSVIAFFTVTIEALLSVTLGGTPVVGQTLVASHSGNTGTVLQWLRNGVAITGQAAASYLLADADDGTQVTVQATDGTQVAMAPPVSVVRPAPTAIGMLPDLSLVQSSGDRVVDASTVFSGAALVYAVAGPAGAAVVPASGLVTIPTDGLLAGAPVAITATNSGGTATVTFAVTVEAAAGAPAPNHLVAVESVVFPGRIEVTLDPNYVVPANKDLRLYVGPDPATPLDASGVAGLLVPGGTHVANGTWPGRAAPDFVYVAAHLVDLAATSLSEDVTAPAVTVETSPATVISESAPPTVLQIEAGRPYSTARGALGFYSTNNFTTITGIDGGVLHADGNAVADESDLASEGETIDMRVSVSASDGTFDLFWSDQITVVTASVPKLSNLTVDIPTKTISVNVDIPCSAHWSLDAPGADPDAATIIAADEPGILLESGANSDALDFAGYADGDYQFNITARIGSSTPATPLRSTITIQSSTFSILTASINEVSPNLGATLTLTTNASGTATYQWKKDAVIVPGATSATVVTTTYGAGDYSCIVTDGTQSVETAAVKVGNGTGVLSHILNIASGNRGLYTDAHGLPTSVAVGETSSDGIFITSIFYWDGVVALTGDIWAWVDPTDSNTYATGKHDLSRLVVDGNSDSTDSVAVPAAGYYVQSTWLTRIDASTTRITLRRNGAQIDSDGLVGPNLADTYVSRMTRISAGYLGRSSPTLHIPYPLVYLAWGTGNPATFHANIWNGGAWRNPNSAAMGSATKKGGDLLVRAGTASFSIGDFSNLRATHGSGHAWIEVPASIPFPA